MSIFPGTGSQNEFFPYVPPAAFSNGELEGRSPSKMQGGSGPRMIYLYGISRFTGYIGMVGPSVYPDTRVIPKWWVLQYIQIHEIISEWLDFQYFQVQTILEQLTTQFHIFKCIDFEFGCESRSSGSFRWIRLVKLVSKKSISAFIRDIFGPKSNFL